MKDKIVILVGPTAVGKTHFALKLAQLFNGEIVSADSMQIYKFMDIGSAKPSLAELNAVKHYLIGEIDPRDGFSVSDYQRRAKEAIRQIIGQSKVPIISGGTGLYVNSLIYDMDFSVIPFR
jgi:tRNA dimethylallyltransferase